jgi:hemin uptake protein HemP
MPTADLPPLPPSPARRLSIARVVAADPTPARAFAVDSHALLKGAREIEIVHGDRVYRLRHTRNDKLILVK